MPKVAIAIAISLFAGFAAAALMLQQADPIVAEVTRFDSSAAIDERLEALERAVSAERQARQMLEEEIFSLYDELDALERAAPDIEAANVAVAMVEGSIDSREMREIARANRRDDSEQRRDALISAGFSASRADWIIQRESELRMEAMQTRYAAMRAGESPNRGYDFANPETALREEMGDAQYETYLQANGRSTAVGVGAVFESSPAQTAGLQPGDEITHYDGERVFNTFDLTRQTMEGDAGQNVVVNITREGMPMQVVIPRGPLGINTGRRR